jgi:hypothetical protein
MGLVELSRAGGDERAIVGKVAVERVALDAGALGDGADGGPRRADRGVKRDRGVDDALTGLVLTACPRVESISASHVKIIAQLCALNYRLN